MARRPCAGRCRRKIVWLSFDLEFGHVEISHLGWSVDELRILVATELIHPDDQERALAHWLDMLSSPGLPFTLTATGRRTLTSSPMAPGSASFFSMCWSAALIAPQVLPCSSRFWAWRNQR